VRSSSQLGMHHQQSASVTKQVTVSFSCGLVGGPGLAGSERRRNSRRRGLRSVGRTAAESPKCRRRGRRDRLTRDVGRPGRLTPGPGNTGGRVLVCLSSGVKLDGRRRARWRVAGGAHRGSAPAVDGVGDQTVVIKQRSDDVLHAASEAGRICFCSVNK